MSLKYRPDIDGLRALAVIPVVMYHAGLGFSGGYVGVDVFFVISGFLITSLIKKELDAGNFSIIDFWARRVRRIIPAVTVVMAACLVAGWFIFWPADYRDLGNSAAAQSLFVSNIYFWMQSGYFDDPSAVKPLLHTWSLSVEEQFYLLFPAVLILLAGVKSSLRIWILGVVATISVVLSVYGSYRHPSATFYLIPTRAWELLAGALLALASSKGLIQSRLFSESLSWAGFVLIACSVLFYNSDTRFPGLAATLPVVGTVFIIWSNSARLTRFGSLLSSSLLVFVGLISYSWYLWHWPLLVFSQYWSLEPLGLLSRVLLVAVSAVIAAISWKFVEIPFRKKRAGQKRGRVLAQGAFALLALSVSGFLIAYTDGAPGRVPTEAAAYADGKKDRAFIQKVTVEDALNGKFVPMGSTSLDAPAHTLVWGDSHAMAVMPVVDALCTEYELRCFGATHSSTAPLLGFESHTEFGLREQSVRFNEAVFDYVKRMGIQNVILVALWRGYGLEEDGENFTRALVTTVEQLGSAGVKVWIMLEAPSHDVDVPRALARASLAGIDVSTLGVSIAEQKEKLEYQRLIFAGVGPDLNLLDPLDYIAGENGHCLVAEGGKSLYSDNHHLSVQGAMKIAPMFETVFSRGN
jgi:peptidoglycan/LPS O-acetylase OafA/YrhL